GKEQFPYTGNLSCQMQHTSLPMTVPGVAALVNRRTQHKSRGRFPSTRQRRQRLPAQGATGGERMAYAGRHYAMMTLTRRRAGVGAGVVDVTLTLARGWTRAAEENRPMRTAPPVDHAPWRDLVQVFLTLGALSPGGPGLIGVLQTEVQEKRGW